jgi:hypothetical protein
MSESGVVGSGGRRSRLEADGLAAEFEQSGMTRKRFARCMAFPRIDWITIGGCVE